MKKRSYWWLTAGLLTLLLLHSGQQTRLPRTEAWTPPQSDLLDSLRWSEAAPLSPYDSLLHACADSIGWDWRMLASVVYHESRFLNHARSYRGALGLMQIHSKRYTDMELLDPATNLQIGSLYLKKLQGMFDAANPTESINFALAAFNLGEGKVRQLCAATADVGLDPAYWENVSTQLPQGHHTVRYVNDVLNTYAYYSQIYPR